VVVCGTGFGRVYLAALRRPGTPLALAGILARGSERSRACAEHYGVPLWTDLGQLPADVGTACVVVGAGINGGPGARLAQELMERGLHVLQEHPLHHDELAGCLRAAQRHRVAYRVDTLFVHIGPVRRFVAAARALLGLQRPLFVDAVCAFQVAYTLFDILDEVLGGLRPWSFPAPPEPAVPDAPYRSIDGLLGGVPCTVRLQNELDPRQPDNFAHLLHRITIGTEGGHLTLVNSHGPVLWSPRPHLPADAAAQPLLGRSAAAHLDEPTAVPIGPAVAPDYRTILAEVWPEGIARALADLHRAAESGDGGRRHGQRHLTLTRVTRDLTAAVGPVRLVRREQPRILPVAGLLAAMGYPTADDAAPAGAVLPAEAAEVDR
jgi:thiazolinyl imide reductase